MSTPDDELKNIFRKNREEILQEHIPAGTSSKIPWRPCRVAVPAPPPSGEDIPPGGFDLVDSYTAVIDFEDPLKTISSQRDLAFEEKVWQQKIQPISDRCFNGEFQHEPSPDVVELTNESITLVHDKIFQIFNKLIDFPTQLNQMAPSVDSKRRQAKELVMAFDDIILKKLRAGLLDSEKKELFFDFLQEIFDTNTLPALLTYLGHFCELKTSQKSEKGLKGRDQDELGINKMLEAICPEIEQFYSDLERWIDYKTNGIDTVEKMEQEELYQLALDCFDFYNETSFPKIDRCIVDDRELFTSVVRRRRKIVATILKKYLIQCGINEKHIPPINDLIQLHNGYKKK